MNNTIRYPLYANADETYPGWATYQEAFGFTKEDVNGLLDKAIPNDRDDRSEVIEKANELIQQWYDGYYAYIDVRLYNPWSVICFLKQLQYWLRRNPSGTDTEGLEKIAQTYWIDTDSTAVLDKLYFLMDGSARRAIVGLINDFGKMKSDPDYRRSIRVAFSNSILDSNNTGSEIANFIEIQKSVTFRQFNRGRSNTDFMTIAYYHGYLAYCPGGYIAIPNYEVLGFWTALLGIKLVAEKLQFNLLYLSQYLFDEEYNKFIDTLKFCYLRSGTNIGPATQEKEYQNMLFMLLNISSTKARYFSSPELHTGGGRADIVLIPKEPGHTGHIIELKRIGPRDEGDSGNQDSESTSSGRIKRSQDPLKGKSDEEIFKSLKKLATAGRDQVVRKDYINSLVDHAKTVLLTSIAFYSRDFYVSFERFEWNGTNYVPDGQSVDYDERRSIFGKMIGEDGGSPHKKAGLN